MAWRTKNPATLCMLAATWFFSSSAMVGAPAPAQAQVQQSDNRPTLTWAVPPFAPAFITDRSVLTGYAAATQNWFAALMPEYHHTVLHVPLARLLAEMKTGEGDLRCSTTLIPTPDRQEYIVFAKTILLHLPISAVVRASETRLLAPYLDQDGHIELPRLLSDGKLSSAIRIGRSYGSQVDKYLDLHRNASHVMQVADDTKFLRMLKLNRIDWTLYFPSEAEFYRRRQTPDLEIKAIPIAGNTTLLEATIGCADTPAGREAIAKINTIIEQNPSMPWTDFYAEWLSPLDREWFKAAKAQYINSDQFEARLEYRPATGGGDR